MSLEEQVRQRQAFDRVAGDYLRSLSGLMDSELELALARVADRLIAASGRAQLHLKVRGRLLHLYAQLRTEGAAKYRKRWRKRLVPKAKELALAEQESRAREQHAREQSQWGQRRADYAVKLAEWNQARARKPWFRRLSRSGEPDPPARPMALANRLAAIRFGQPTESQISEALIEYAATFELPVFSRENEAEVTKEEVKLLLVG